jgi:DNA-binding NarL/FixJ family response regulator
MGSRLPGPLAGSDRVDPGFQNESFPGTMRAMGLRILIAEDERIVLQGVRALLEQAGFEVVAEAADGREALSLAARLHPDMAILDLAMDGMNGLTAAQEMARVSPATRTVLLTSHRDEEQVLEALDARVKGYVLKAQALADLVVALHEVARGHVYLSPGIAQTVVDACVGGRRPPPHNRLTPREKEVIQLIAEGKSTKEVAQVLGVSVKTAEFHRSRLMEKLEIHETASLVRYAIRKGLVQP